MTAPRAARLVGAALATCLAASTLAQRLTDPIPETIAKGNIVVAAERFVRAPQTSDPAKPRFTNDAYARIQYLLPIPGQSGRLAFNDTRGLLYLTDAEGKPPAVYLDLRKQNVGFSSAALPNEAGFMGFAFHPQFTLPREPGYGKFYTAYTATPESGVADYADATDNVHHSVIREWTARDPAAPVFAGTSREVMRVGEFAPNHNVGTIAFNPDADADDFGLLYIGFGDGGSAHDPADYGQGLAEPLGAIVRIDPLAATEERDYGIPPDNPFVDTSGVAAEIWAYGLRHPQQFSWAADGRMFIGDIGQDQVEEINLGVAGGNYGWRLREGTFATGHAVGGQRGPVYALPASDDQALIYPVAQYDHDEGHVIGGGFLYRGEDVPALRGKYLFTEVARGRLLAVDASELTPGEPAPIEEVRIRVDGKERELAAVAGFANTYRPGELRVDLRLGSDADGELYLLTKGDGWIRKVVSVSEAQDAIVGLLLKRPPDWLTCDDGSEALASAGEQCMKTCTNGERVAEDQACVAD